MADSNSMSRRERRRLKRRRKLLQGEPSAVDLIEEGIHLLRQTPISAWAVYLSGMAPFVLGFLYFWTEMASSGLAGRVLLPGAVGLTLLFIWLKLAQVYFARGLREALHDTEEPAWTLATWAKVLWRQTFWQSTGLISLPIGMIITFPFAWLSAFYQNLLVSDPQEEVPEQGWAGENWRLARIWHEQNWILLTLIGIVSFLCFINILSVVAMVPFLLKSLLGIETVFSRSFNYLFNTTTLFSCLMLSYAVTDPLVKAVYLLRLHYCASRRSGADLSIRFRRGIAAGSIRKVLTGLLLLGGLMMVSESGPSLMAQEEGGGEGLPLVEADSLDESIDEVFQRREFVWRFPREETEAEAEGWEWLESFFDTLNEWRKSFEEWWDGLFDRDKERQRDRFETGGWEGFAGIGSVLSYTLIGVFVLLLIFFGVRAWQMYQPLDTVEGSTSNELELKPDLNEEDIAADMLPQNEWIILARELIAKGDYRLALRAYFLAQLSELSSEGLIVIRRSKSNREYGREISRRAHGRKGLLDLYTRQVRLFESVWYGDRPTGPEEIGEMESHLQGTGVLA